MAARPIALVAGLGNPGPEYAETRHNAGFHFVERLAGSAPFRHEPRFEGDVARVNVAGHELWLLKPTTFMNHSGSAVGKLARFYKITPAEILVVHDELDLVPGTARLKQGGGAGGHNGLTDIIAQLGGPDFARLRLGIGRPAPGGDVAAWVLKRASAADRALLEDSISAVLAQMEQIVRGDHAKVMNVLHTHTR